MDHAPYSSLSSDARARGQAFLHLAQEIQTIATSLRPLHASSPGSSTNAANYWAVNYSELHGLSCRLPAEVLGRRCRCYFGSSCLDQTEPALLGAAGRPHYRWSLPSLSLFRRPRPDRSRTASRRCRGLVRGWHDACARSRWTPGSAASLPRFVAAIAPVLPLPAAANYSHLAIGATMTATDYYLCSSFIASFKLLLL